MPATMNHKFVSGKADGADGTFVQPSKWNQNHNFGGGADGQILQRDSVQVDGADWISLPAFGNARLVFSSSTLVQLNAGIIPQKVGGTWKLTYSAAVTISNASLAASTTYFVYAFDSAGTRTLELSTTGHVTDATFGVEVKSADATRTLVGMVRTNAGVTFQDDNGLRGVLSYYNRRAIGIVNNFTVDRTTTSTTYAELNTEIRANFLTWGDEAVMVAVNGSATNSSVPAANGTAIAFDGTSAETGLEANHTVTSAAAGENLHVSGYKTLSEGYHYATLLGKTNAGTATWSSATGAAAAKVGLHVAVRG